MKKWMTFALCILLCITLVLPSFAAEDLLKPRRKLHTYYYESAEPATLPETLAYIAEGMTFPQNTPYFPDPTTLTDPADKAYFILAQLAMGADADALAEHATATDLLALQQENGAFGDAQTTALCLMALRSVVPTKFSAEKAVNALLSMQDENGSFGDAQTNGLVLAALAPQLAQQPVADAVSRCCEAVELPQTAEEIAWLTLGFSDVGATRTDELMTALLTYQQEDGSFGDPSASVAALLAFNAYESGNSVFVRLAENGNLQVYTLDDFLPFLITLGVLAAGSVVFWVFVLVRKPKN